MFDRFMTALVFLVAGTYIWLVYFAQSTCSIIPNFGNKCSGPEGDIWMLPFFVAPVCLPIVALAMFLAVRSLWRHMRKS